MGLDIYVRFGEKTEDEDGYEAWDWYKKTSPYHDLYEDQMTGMLSAPYAGYLRESWPSLRWTLQAAERYGGPDPYDFFPDWQGYNGEELRLDNGNLARVLAFRDEVLRPYLRNREARSAVYQRLQTEVFGTPDSAIKPNREELLALQEKYGEELKEFDAYRRRCADAVGFINFVELHKDKPNLTILFS